MPKRHELTNKEWEMIEPLLPKRGKRGGRSRLDDRAIINAILWILGTEAPWRDLPESYGKWDTVYSRFQLWTKLGVWEEIFATIIQSAERGPSVEFAAIIEVDSITCKAHRHVAGGKGSGIQRLRPLSRRLWHQDTRVGRCQAFLGDFFLLRATHTTHR